MRWRIGLILIPISGSYITFFKKDVYHILTQFYEVGIIITFGNIRQIKYFSNTLYNTIITWWVYLSFIIRYCFLIVGETVIEKASTCMYQKLCTNYYYFCQFHKLSRVFWKNRYISNIRNVYIIMFCVELYIKLCVIHPFLIEMRQRQRVTRIYIYIYIYIYWKIKQSTHHAYR